MAKLQLQYHDCKVFGYFKRIRNAISFAAFPWRSYNRICDILENLSGVGIRIEKQTKENTRWLLVADAQAPCVPEIDAVVGDGSESSASSSEEDDREIAGTVTVTPCNSEPKTITIRNGRDGVDGVDGEDGCSPTIEVEGDDSSSSSSSSGGDEHGEMAGRITITPCEPFTHEDPVTGEDVPEVDGDGNPLPRTITIYNGKNGEDGTNGCSPDIDVSTGSAGAGTVAGTITITPCEPFTHEDPQTHEQVPEVDGQGNPLPRTITVYNGKDGEDGCTPTVSVQQGSAGAGTVAGTISITPCGGSQTDITVYNGKDATGSLSVVTGMRISSGQLQYQLSSYTFVAGVLTLQNQSWNNLGVQFDECPADSSSSGSES